MIDPTRFPGDRIDERTLLAHLLAPTDTKTRKKKKEENKKNTERNKCAHTRNSAESHLIEQP